MVGAKKGASVLGIEPSATFYENLLEDSLPCIHGSLENVNLDVNVKYNIIVMLHVFEHFYDPNTALQQCRNLLTPNGLLVVEVPNILKPYRSLDHYFLRYVHPSNFSPQTLRIMLQKHGYKVRLMDEGLNDWRVPQSLFVIAQRLDSVQAHTLDQHLSADEVLRQLDKYRRQWKIFLGPCWHIYQQHLRIRRLFFRTASKVKRFFVSSP